MGFRLSYASRLRKMCFGVGRDGYIGGVETKVEATILGLRFPGEPDTMIFYINTLNHSRGS